MQILKGAPVAAAIRDEIKKELEGCETKPCLAIVRVGEKQEDLSYERSALKRMSGVGIETKLFVFPADISMDDFSAEFAAINDDPTIDGILLFRPLPAQLNESQIVESIAPEKDVDGFHPYNVGLLSIGKADLKACTPAGCIELIKRSGVDITGKKCVVVGRSNIVGKPVGMLLLAENGTVITCHSKTKDIASVCREADILVAAVGIPKFITGDMVSDGVVVIDVGINRNEEGKLCGDVDFESVEPKASYITPVPGGVGPMTIAMLMKNCLTACKKQNNL